jgi:hypothetical protein
MYQALDCASGVFLRNKSDEENIYDRCKFVRGEGRGGVAGGGQGEGVEINDTDPGDHNNKRKMAHILRSVAIVPQCPS